MRAIGKTHFGEEAAAVEVAFRLLSGVQSGPRAGTKEAAYIAGCLAEAAKTLRAVEEHRVEVAEIIGDAP